MSLPNSCVLNTQPFEATRRVLACLDTKVFGPACAIEFLAVPPRIVQIAINTLGLIDSAASSTILSLVCWIPLPQSIKGTVQVWRDDAWNLLCQLIDKIARLIIATIPLAGSKILALLDNAETSNKRLSEQIDGLKATGFAHDATIARNLKVIEELRAKNATCITDCKKTIEDLSAKNTVCTATCEKLKGENAVQSHLADTLRQQLAELKESHVHEINALAAAHQQKIDEIQSAHEKEQKALQDQLKAVQDQNAALQPVVDENKSLSAYVLELTQKADVLEGEIIMLEQSKVREIETLSSEHQEQIRGLTSQITALSIKNQDQESQIQDQESTIEQLHRLRRRSPSPQRLMQNS